MITCNNQMITCNNQRRTNVKTIERDIVISEDGRLPKDLRGAFGRKARMVVHRQKGDLQSSPIHPRLMPPAGKIQAFQDFGDPVGFQREHRNSWKRGLDQWLRTASWLTPKTTER